MGRTCGQAHGIEEIAHARVLYDGCGTCLDVVGGELGAEGKDELVDLSNGPAHGEYAVSTRTMHGQRATSAWPAHGQCTASARPAHGQRRIRARPVRGLHIASAGAGHG